MKKTGLLFAMLAIVMAFSATSQEVKEKAAAKSKNDKKVEKEHIVQITTDYGVIKLKLYNDTPIHRDNFLKLAKEGQYNGSIFHRVIQGFMIQGGGLAAEDGMETLPAEIVAGRYHKRGALAAARMGDNVNPEKRSSPSQFYIVQGVAQNETQLQMISGRMGKVFSEQAIKDYATIGGAAHLDGDYTVFGEVIEGMDVVDKISAVEKRADKPVKDITMKITVLQ